MTETATSLSSSSSLRFCPTNDELVEKYLKPKIEGLPISPNTVEEHGSHFLDPESIDWSPVAHLKDHERYLFIKRVAKSKSGKKVKRGSEGQRGFWRAAQVNKEISNGAQVVGLMNLLNFMVYDPQSPKGSFKTRWIMHEFILADTTTTFQEWSVCRVKYTGREIGRRPPPSDHSHPSSSYDAPSPPSNHDHPPPPSDRDREHPSPSYDAPSPPSDHEDAPSSSSQVPLSNDEHPSPFDDDCYCPSPPPPLFDDHNPSPLDDFHRPSPLPDDDAYLWLKFPNELALQPLVLDDMDSLTFDLSPDFFHSSNFPESPRHKRPRSS